MSSLVVIIAFLLVGCGEAFTTTAFSNTAHADVEVDAAPPPGTGGVMGTGGSSHSTGGSFQETGGSSQTGGAVGSTGGAETGGMPPSTGGAAPATGGAPPVVDAGCALVTHNDGTGQTWEDCTPLGTYSQEQAMKACEAWRAVNGGGACQIGTSAPCGDSLERVHVSANGFYMGWVWQGANAGDVAKSSSGGCTVIGTWG